jgi:hypothetical protein
VQELGDLPAQKTTKFTRPIGGQALRSFVQSYGSHFSKAVSDRRQAFGGNTVQISDIPHSTMAASFISQMEPQNQPPNNANFIAPQGMDLSPLLERGQAVLLAWAPDYAPAKPLNRFSARRTHRDTLLRVATFLKTANEQ